LVSKQPDHVIHSSMRRSEREIKDIDEIESIISRCDVCRIALADNNFPYIVTMNFGYFPGECRMIYFHSAVEGRKIEMIRNNNFVCFEMDTDHRLIPGSLPCDYTMKYSSIIGWGKITIVESEEERKAGLESIISHVSGKNEFNFSGEIFKRTAVLRLDIMEMTGKKL
jgi:nitroimidazol reductase NimA-like FMN-containing flavoprotein (pyridoxamine 5'-phosphate oxidase superfamily)